MSAREKLHLALPRVNNSDPPVSCSSSRQFCTCFMFSNNKIVYMLFRLSFKTPLLHNILQGGKKHGSKIPRKWLQAPVLNLVLFNISEEWLKKQEGKPGRSWLREREGRRRASSTNGPESLPDFFKSCIAKS